MASPRRLCVVTGTRADYGLIQWLMRDIADDPELCLQVVATGTHLDPAFGLTVGQIERDGFTVDARVPLALGDDSACGTARAMADALAGLAPVFERLAPDLVILTGDRYEMLAAALAAALTRRPMAHLYGGEVTEGALDEGFRHAISKLAHLHFTAAEPYARRLIQMGEQPDRVFDFGAPSLDHLDRLPLPGRAELEGVIGRPLSAPLLLITYHPATLAEQSPAQSIAALLAALEPLPGAQVFTGVNADPGHSVVGDAIAAYAARRPDTSYHLSLGQRNYLGMMALADAVVGNSSSGIIEAPALGVPTVNLGVRQKGRLRAASIIDCAETPQAIAAALAQALDPAFRAGLAGMVPPYRRADASRRIKDCLKAVPLHGLGAKPFFDLPEPP